MTMRLACLVGGLSLAACGHSVRTGVASTDVAAHIISLERSALDRWVKADPDGYLSLYASDASYFDPFREKRLDGLDQLNAFAAGMRGVKLPFTEPR